MDRLAVFGSLLSLLLTGTLAAQIETATLLGTVKDSSGAVVPGAAVTAKNLGTGLARSAVTDSSGNYTIVDLPAAHYAVSVSLAGFQTTTIPDIEIQVAQKARVDAILQVGTVGQQVTVTAAPPLLSTASSSVGQVVNTQAVENMPLNGRSFWQLTQLTPGATYVPGGQGARTGGSSIRARVVNVSVNGTDSIWTGWSLDGANITEFELGGTLIQPNVDALQEFKVESANMPAEYGHTPSMVNATLKSGTNAFHGDVFEFLRNDQLDARNFFFRPPPGSNQTKDTLRRNQFGYTFGGPIRRDRVFVFSDLEETRLRQGVVFNSVVPSVAMRGGDFSELLAGKSPVEIVDPLTGKPFDGNRIPAAQFSQQAQFFLTFLPVANFVQGGASRAVETNALAQDIAKGDVKVDAQLRTQDRLMARYSIADSQESDPNPFPALGAFPLHSRAQNATLALTHIFSSHWLDEARFSYYRSIFLFGGTLEGTDFDKQAGIRGFENTTSIPSFPQITMAGFATFTGSPSDQRPKSNRIRTWQYVDNVSYAGGKHNIKVGMEWYHQTHGFFNGSSSVGVFNFAGTYTKNGFADFLLGFPDSVTRDFFKDLNGNWDNFKAFYFQDNYRATPNLTLNLGLRWEINPFYHGIRGQVSGFDFRSGKVVIPSDFDPTAQPGTATLLPLFRDRIAFSGDLGLPESIRPSDRRALGPRIGLAWTPFGSSQWVIRSAYGIFYVFPDTNLVDNTVATVPFVGQQTTFNDRPPAAPTRTWDDFFQGQPVASGNPKPGQPCAFGFAALSCATPDVTAGPLETRSTYVQQWNLAIQRQIRPAIAFDVAYVGNRTVRLQNFIQRNDPAPGAGDIQARRPYPQWGRIRMTEWGGKANYHSLQAKLESRGWHGLTLLASYSVSKCLDTGTDEQEVSALRLPINNGACDFDRPQSFVLSYNYELPLGKGKRFLSGAPGWMNQALGGWQIAGIATLQSGLPFTPTVSGDVANTGVSSQRPDRVGNPALPHTVSCWFFTSANSSCTALLPNTPDAFVLPPAKTRYGTSGRNILRADALSQLDFTLMKYFLITEAKSLEFRSEFFNILNHPTFSAPSTTINTSSGGQVGSTLNAARIIQMALKFRF